MESVDRKTFRAVRKTRVSKGIIDQIRDLISSGRIQPGDQLPAERELAQTFHVGRSTVREAIRTMESLGFVEVRSGEGTFLAGLSSSARPGPDPITATLFKEWSTQLKVFEVRAVLEPGLASMAASRATSAHIESMRTILAEQEAALQRGETGMKEGDVFHSLIVEATGNEILTRLMGSLMDLLKHTREVSSHRSGRPARSLKQHHAILQAVVSRNPRLAERRMREHIRTIEHLVFSVQPSVPEKPAATSSTPSPDIFS